MGLDNADDWYKVPLRTVFVDLCSNCYRVLGDVRTDLEAVRRHLFAPRPLPENDDDVLGEVRRRLVHGIRDGIVAGGNGDALPDLPLCSDDMP